MAVATMLSAAKHGGTFAMPTALRSSTTNDAIPLEQTNLAMQPEHTAVKQQLATLLPAAEADDLPSGNRRAGRRQRLNRNE